MLIGGRISLEDIFDTYLVDGGVLLTLVHDPAKHVRTRSILPDSRRAKKKGTRTAFNLSRVSQYSIKTKEADSIKKGTRRLNNSSCFPLLIRDEQ
jgi:hypothetical protein